MLYRNISILKNNNWYYIIVHIYKKWKNSRSISRICRQLNKIFVSTYNDIIISTDNISVDIIYKIIIYGIFNDSY